jgi:hypothetical protein
MMERSACGVQSIICIHCKRKMNLAGGRALTTAPG